MHITKHPFTKPLFPLGHIVSTPGAMAACPPEQLLGYLARHADGDWGHVCSEDAAANDAAVIVRGRILSAYAIDPARPSKGFGANALWIITECDHSVTTMLLPNEY